MIEYLTIEAGPVDEECLQIGEATNKELFAEAMRFKGLLLKCFPQIDNYGVTFRIIGNHHELGKYYDINILYNDDNASSFDYALFIESNLPKNWADNKARVYNENNS